MAGFYHYETKGALCNHIRDGIIEARLNERLWGYLRAEGGYKVSATRKNNNPVWFSIVSSSSGIVRIADIFNGQVPKWNLADVQKHGNIYEVKLYERQKL